MKVKWNGADRELTPEQLQQLVDRDIERGSIDSAREALRAEFGKLGGYQALENAVAQWTPEQQQRFQEILQDPTRLIASPSNGHHQNGHSEEDDDDSVDMTRRIQQAPRQPQPNPEMEKVRQAVGWLIQREQNREESRQAEDRAAQVTEKLNEFSVFKTHPGALNEARQSVIDHLIANPKASVDDAVARMASFTQGLLEKAGQRQPGPLAQTGGAPVPTWPQDLKVDPSRIGDRMLSGQSELDAERLFQDLISGRRPEV